MLLQSWAFSRVAIEDGEVWRLLAANLAHLSWPHLYGNLALFAAAVALLRSVAGPMEVLAVLAFSSLATTTGLYAGSSLDWYVGASGALYGLLAWGAARLPMPFGLWLLTALALNMAIDQGRTLSWLGEPLAPQGHYWGLAGGLALAIVSAMASWGNATGAPSGPAAPSTARISST